jgi:hypothetical protein
MDFWRFPAGILSWLAIDGEQFRTAVLLNATDMQSLTIDNYNNFTGAGGLFPSQYELSGTDNIWSCIQPDIWGTQSGEFAAIAVYNQ